MAVLAAWEVSMIVFGSILGVFMTGVITYFVIRLIRRRQREMEQNGWKEFAAATEEDRRSTSTDVLDKNRPIVEKQTNRSKSISKSNQSNGIFSLKRTELGKTRKTSDVSKSTTMGTQRPAPAPRRRKSRRSKTQLVKKNRIVIVSHPPPTPNWTGQSMMVESPNIKKQSRSAVFPAIRRGGNVNVSSKPVSSSVTPSVR